MSEMTVIPTLQTVTEIGATSNQALTLSGNNTHSGNNTFSGSNSFSNGSFATRYLTNVFNQYGTGGIWRQYSNGTDCIVERVSGSGAFTLGASGSRNDIILGKIALGDSAVSANFFINYLGSGGNRGAMSFDFTQTGSNISVASNFKVTSQRTGGTSAQTCTIHGIVKDEDLTGTQNYVAISTAQGTINTRTITQGTHNFVGVDVTSGSVGTANTGGTVNNFGVRIAALTDYTGVATYTEFGINCGSDVVLRSDVKHILEGSATVKGDSYFVFNSATTDVDCFVDGTKAQTWDNDQTDFHVNIGIDDAINVVLATTTGTKIGTATTQKIGFWNKTPVAQPSAYTPSNVTTDRSYDANSTSLDELADVVGTLIADLQSIGLVG